MSAQVHHPPHALDFQVFSTIREMLESQGDYLFVKGSAVFRLQGIRLSDSLDSTFLSSVLEVAPRASSIHLQRGQTAHDDDMVVITTQQAQQPTDWQTLPEHSHVRLGLTGNGQVNELDEEPRIPFEKISDLPSEHRAVRRHAFGVECAR
jgi:hypothetical protein